jgi:uncharacterized protein
MITLIFLLLGLGVGIFSGIVGIGGGIIIVPILAYAFHMSQHKAQGTSLGALLLPVGLFAFLQYYRAGNVDTKAAIAIAVGFLVGGYFGGAWAQHFSDVALRKGFAIVLLGIALKMLWG